MVVSHRSLFVVGVLCTLAAAQTTTPSLPLPASDGWRAEQIHQADSGVWYLHVDKVVADYGQNELIAADDKGRFLLLTVYSGQWTAHSVVADGQWLAPTRSADVDPRVPGREMYAGGRGGSLHRVTLRPQPFARFTLESVEIGHAAGEEFHAVVAADLVPGGNDELVAFAISGAVYQLLPAGDHDAFAMRKIGSVPGRVRDCVVVPGAAGAPATLFGVSRSGDLLRMRLQGNGAASPSTLQHDVLLHEDSGLGRIALAKGRQGVMYATRDDGVVVRVELAADGRVRREAILACGLGLRGIASGRFFADDRECVAAYGYDRTVHLVHRRVGAAGDASSWQVETIFQSAQKGHWLAVGELDGRNGTDELVASGFDGQIVLLSRPAGYGVPGLAVAAAERSPAVASASGASPGKAPSVEPAALRVAARVGDRGLAELSPLRYYGGFETKTLAYETLVRIGADGRLAPGLASAWRVEDGGKTVVLTLRDGAKWHDGTEVTAADVALHCKRWLGLPEHGWLRSARHVERVRAIGARELRFELAQPAALLADLCVINPAAVQGPGSFGRDGEFVRPIGSGAFAVVGPTAGNAALRYRQVGGEKFVDLVRIEGDALDALMRGEVDAVVGSDLIEIAPARAAALQKDPRVQVVAGPGSAVWHLALRHDRGPLAELVLRQAIAAAVDREELVRVAAHGFGAPLRGYVAPSIADWPQGAVVSAPTNVPALASPLRLHPGRADSLLVTTLMAQLERAGIPVVVTPAGPGGAGDGDDWDLRLERTHGVPYDPFGVAERFGAPAARATESTPTLASRDGELLAAIDALLGATDPATWPQHYARIQARLDALLPIVPLFAPARLAVVRAGLPVPKLDHDLYRLDAEWLIRAR